MASSYPLVPVQFQGDNIHAIRDESGEVWVVVLRLCEVMGIDYRSQYVKLQDKPWAKTAKIVTATQGGYDREMFCIHLDSLPMWLTTIDSSRVAPGVRAKLAVYQAECARVLATHFFGRSPLPPAKPWSDRFRESFAPHHRAVLSGFPPGCFTAITEGVMTMLMLEDQCIRHMMEVRPGDRPCISIGLCWSNYRKLEITTIPAIGEAPIWLPDVQREVPVKVYPGDELHDFKKWLHFVYLPTKLQPYLDGKKEFRPHGSLPRASVTDNTCYEITGRRAELTPAVRRQLTAADNFVPASGPLSLRG